MILAASTKSNGSSAYLLIGLVALFGLLYFVTIRPQRRRQQHAQQTQRNIEPGARVRTTAGLYGTVVAVEDQDVILEVAPGVEARFMRRAIMDVVPDSTETEYSEAPEDVADDEPEDVADDEPEDVTDDEPEDVTDDEPEHSEDAPEHTPKTRSEAEDDAATG
jgi:preprotein translocase subunit YajC